MLHDYKIEINNSNNLKDNTMLNCSMELSLLNNLFGENLITVKVTAENGNVRTYVIKAIVEEPNPIKVTIDNKEYTIVRKKEGLEILIFVLKMI